MLAIKLILDGLVLAGYEKEPADKGEYLI